MPTMSTLTPDREARFLLDYPDYPDPELAERYGITVTAVQQLASRNHLRKSNETRRQAAREAKVRSLDGNRPAVFPRFSFRGYPSHDYCGSCGLSHHHLPGCPQTDLDDRPVIASGD
jgi:hypothetical protein